MYIYIYIYRGKKITCPGARDKWNFRQDKYIFSPNVLQTSKKFNARFFCLFGFNVDLKHLRSYHDGACL